MRRWLTLMFAILIPAMVFANDAKLAPELKQAASDHVVSVIVQYKTVPGNIHKDRIRMSGGAVVRDLALVKSVTAQVPSSALAALSEDDAVVYISPDRPVRSHMNNAAPAVLASYAWSLGLDGSGIGVAVIDSGIHNVDDLADSSGQSRIVYSLDLVGGGTDDGYGHGTHVAGIIGGNGKDSTCPTCDVAIRGIAPNVNLINLRALDNTGAGTDSTVIAAIEAAIQLKDTYNIRVINLSVGRPVYESYTQDPVCQAVEQAWQAGIVVVVSAGNDGRDNSMGTNGYGTIEAPGNDPYVITVGAMNTKGTPDRSDDVMTSYSSKGPTVGDSIVKPDLVAPGNRVVSLQEPGTLLQTYPQNRPLTGYYMKGIIPRPSSAYFTLSGTSMATGVVSGAAALMLQQDPTLTPDQVKARLMKTAYKNLPPYTTVVDTTTVNGGGTYYIQSDGFTVGAGYLDLQAALNNTDLAPGIAKSPTAYYDASSGNVFFLGDSQLCGEPLLSGAPTPSWPETQRCGAIPLCGVARQCGGTRQCGVTQPCGVTRLCGAIRPRGVTRLCGVILLCGAIRRLTVRTNRKVMKVIRMKRVANSNSNLSGLKVTIFALALMTAAPGSSSLASQH